MEKDKVPQDDANVYEGISKVVYAVDKDGNYQKVPSKGWEPENIALDQAWETINKKIAEAKLLVEKGELSSLGYHMEKDMLNPVLLSEYMGWSVKKIKKHLNPKEFAKLNEAELEQYAYVFRISKEEFLKTD
jgi:hypothetical protein